jgi:hypothetical protein
VRWPKNSRVLAPIGAVLLSPERESMVAFYINARLAEPLAAGIMRQMPCSELPIFVGYIMPKYQAGRSLSANGFHTSLAANQRLIFVWHGAVARRHFISISTSALRQRTKVPKNVQFWTLIGLFHGHFGIR